MSTLAAEVSGFPDLLRYWRGFRRLSQLDLAVNADVSQRHVSFLESGRSKPSRDMVLQLAESLELPLRERNRMLGAAGFAAVYAANPLSDADMAPVKKALDLILTHHEPFPAVLVDANWKMLQPNSALLRLFSLIGDIGQIWAKIAPQEPPNVFKLTFHPQGLRPYIRNFEEIAPVMINRTFREAHEHPQLLALLEEVLSYPDTPSRWKTPDLSAHLPPVMNMELCAAGHTISLFSTITTFGTAQDITTDELRVESFFPGDSASEALLRALADGSLKR